jgi:hypothetical protein
MTQKGEEQSRKIVGEAEELTPGATRQGRKQERDAGSRHETSNGRANAKAIHAEISDSSLARSFAYIHQNELRYVAFWNRWLRFDGTRWVTGETRHAFDLVHDHCRNAARSQDTTARKALEAAKKVAAVHTLAQADRRLAAESTLWDASPDMFNERGG